MTDEEQLREVGWPTVSCGPPSSVILFGSHARGSAGPRSDIDILVIEPEVENPAIESVRLMRDLRLPLEIVVVSERDSEEWCAVRGSLVHGAMAEGRVLIG